jgi:glycerol uptake facilitator-like aquaporin
MPRTLARRLLSEGLGTGLLLAAVVGSGIMAERLAGGNTALALLANAIATGAALLALILTFGPVSAHFNPAVSLSEAWQGNLNRRDLLPYIATQCAGAVLGVAAANLMFGLPAMALSHHPRHGGSQVFSEVIATFGLVAVIIGCSRRQPAAIAQAVAGYITAAYWFTASTSFANPAAALGRALTDTFAGIRIADVPAFVAAELVGAALATVAIGWLFPRVEAPHVVLSPVPDPQHHKEAS